MPRMSSVSPSSRRAASLIVRVRRLPLVVEEKLGILWSTDELEAPWRLGQIEESSESVLRARIGKMKGPFDDSEIGFDEAENAPEVVAVVINVTGRRVGGHDHQ